MTQPDPAPRHPRPAPGHGIGAGPDVAPAGREYPYWAEVRDILERLGRLPPDVRGQVLEVAVKLDARALGLGPAFEPGAERPGMGAANAVATGVDPAAGGDWAARAEALCTWEQALDRREAQLEVRAAALDALEGVEPAWTVPAAPAAAQLRALIIETGDDVATVAHGLGVDPGWARGVLTGEITEVAVPDVQRLCEGLHCSPYDLFGAEAARSIAHAYGPELWPRYIEPLEPLGVEGLGKGPEPPPLDLDP